MEFTAFKMDGLGNDFVIIDKRIQNIDLIKSQIIKICDRNFIGCDQLIFINKSKNSIPELKFYNSDGSIAEACGNGTRCVAQLLSKETNNKVIEVLTSSGKLISKIFENNIVETEIGIPKINWKEIPIIKKMDTKNLNINISDKYDKEIAGGTAVNVGNPHVVFFVNNFENFKINEIGPKIENHELFPEKCNVTLAEKIDENHIKVNVWERGAGLTKACGTAACATAFVGKINNFTGSKVDIEFELGRLSINIDQKNSIHMKGPVSEIKKIKINI